MSSPDSSRAAEFQGKGVASNPSRLVEVRSVFWSRNAGGVRHPHFVLTPMQHESEQVIVVNCTSEKLDGANGRPLPKQDYSCRLQVGDHEWITLPSIMFYRGAELWTPREVQTEANPGTANVSEHFVSKELLFRMQRGLLDSRHTPMEVHEFLLSFRKK